MMKIKWLEFENLTTGLKINRIDFYDNLTVMVGLSGAGKTQILEAITTICSLATENASYRQDKLQLNASMCFNIDDKLYTWKIKTNCKPDVSANNSDDLMIYPLYLRSFDFTKNIKETIIYEELICDGEKIFNRDEKNTYFKGYNELPNSNGDVSLIYQYHTHDYLKSVHSHLNKLYDFYAYTNVELLSERLNKLSLYKEELKNTKYETYVNSFPHNLPLTAKLLLLKETNESIYKKMLNTYQEVFPEINDFKIDKKIDNSDVYTIFFETKNASIDFQDISSGMRKTFMFLFDVFTISSDYVFLIDEIENGLGINCINEVYSYVYRFRNDLQFIITSHHPYIINNIKPSQCKIINRIDNVISSYSAQELNLTNEYYSFFDVILNKLKNGEIS